MRHLNAGLLAAAVSLMLFVACGSSAGPDAGGGSKCGNGTLETDEECEGFDLRGRTCVSEGFVQGQLRCTPSCTIDRSSCSKCGDGVISGAERCEPATLMRGGIFGSKTCASELDAGAIGELRCSSTCDRVITDLCDFPAALPGRNEPCSVSSGCSAGLTCDLVSSSPVTFRCQKHCAAAGIGTSAGCASGELCLDGGLEVEGASQTPPAYVYCPPSSCGTGFTCADAGVAGLCTRPTGICR